MRTALHLPQRLASRASQRGQATTEFVVLALVLGLLLPGTARAALACGDLKNASGPFDYRNDRAMLPVVNSNHFTPEVEALLRGITGSIGNELDFVLRAYPNHHRALLAVMNYGLKMKALHPSDLPRPVECYFERALRFRPDDSIARMIYAKFLAANNRKPDAVRELEFAIVSDADNGFTQHNIGLVFFEMGIFDAALKQAHRAAALGFPGTVLRDQLSRNNRWHDAPAELQPSAVTAPRSPAPSASEP